MTTDTQGAVAYLYHDASTPEDAHPWLHSTMLVLAADRRPKLRNETPLVTLAQAVAMVAAERDHWRRVLDKIVFAWDARSELFSNDADCAAAMRDYADMALRAVPPWAGPNVEVTGRTRSGGLPG